jgi:hypothetical protein
MATKKAEDDRSLKRLGGGRWQTRDERFTIEPQSGTWVLVDAEQTDDLGLPLVRGPFRSLTDAKAAVEAARDTAAPESPLAERVKDAGTRPARTPAASAKAGVQTPARTKEPAAKGKSVHAKATADVPAEPEPPPEPRWIADLGPRDRGRARRLIERLHDAGVRDPEGIVRQDLTGGVPTIARVAVADRLATLLATAGEKTDAIERALGSMLEAVGDGRDDELGVRWRLVDEANRPIGVTAADVRAATKRRADDAGKEKDR